MQQLIAKEIKHSAEGYVSYEIQWIIPDWREVRRDVGLVKDQKATFETGQHSYQTIQTKWLVGLKDVPFEEKSRRARVYWQLLDIKGSGSQLKLESEIYTELCNRKGVPEITDMQIKTVSLFDIIEENEEYLDVGGTLPEDEDEGFINSNGAIQYTLILTFEKPVVDSINLKKIKLEQFSKRSVDQLRENLEALLNQDSASGGDLKIITSDRVELTAHQTILKAQCPVFAGMLNSDLSESKTGIVKVEDISGKTMKILLHYFYTGDLLKGWNDDDTIVEFTYAAGKYQIAQVLDLLDDLFGRRDQDQVSNLDVQLLDLAGKLSLKNAEKRLLQRIIAKVTAAKSSEDLFQLFGYDSEEVSRNAVMLAAEPLGESNVLEILDDACENANQKMAFAHRGLILLALVQTKGPLKTLEKILLKRFAEITIKLTTAEELFALFGDGK